MLPFSLMPFSSFEAQDGQPCVLTVSVEAGRRPRHSLLATLFKVSSSNNAASRPDPASPTLLWEMFRSPNIGQECNSWVRVGLSNTCPDPVCSGSVHSLEPRALPAPPLSLSTDGTLNSCSACLSPRCLYITDKLHRPRPPHCSRGCFYTQCTQ